MKTKLSKILFGIMFALLVVAGGGLFGACKKSSGKVEPDMPKEPSVVYDGDILPLEVEDGTLLRYTGEQNAVIEIPATYSIDEYGNIVVGDTYQITKIADEAFKGVKFFDAYIDMSNVTEIGNSAFKEVRNLTVSEMPKLNVVRDYAFYKAAVNFKSGDLQKVTYFGAYSFAESKGYEMPANSSLQTVHATDIDTQSGNLRIGGNNTITNIYAGTFANSNTYSGYGLIFGSGIVTVQSDAAFYNMGITSVDFTGGTYNLTAECFGKNTDLTKLTMKGNFGDTTKENFKYTFADCTSLVAVNLPRSGITGIREETFSGCTGLTKITRSATEATSGGVINFQFAPAENCGYTTFSAPQSITEIDGGAFRGFGKLQQMKLPFVGRNTSVATNNANGEGHFGYIFGNTYFEGASKTTQNVNNGSFDWYIPKTLTRIDLSMNRPETTAWAFMNMTYLTTVNITKGSATFTSLMGSTFKGCTGLTSVSLPSTTTSFGGSVFYGCTSLQNITLPSSLSSIGASAFENCTSLRSITLPSTLSGDASFPYHYNGGTVNGVAAAESNLFKNCTSLVAVNIPRTIKGQNMNDTTMFAGCTGLTKITRNATAQTTGGVINFQFADTTSNTATTSFRIPASITTIDNNAFKNWTVLQYLNLYDGGVVESFGIDACRGCSALVKVSFSTSLKTLGNNCFYGCSKLGNHSERTYLTFSSGLTTIGTYCFYNCSSLQAVNLPSTLTTLGSNAFSGCTLLKSWTRNTTEQKTSGAVNFYFSTSTACALSGALYISGPVTSIAANCFRNFTSITSVTIPSGITTISANSMFYNCSALSSVTFPSSGLTSISGTYMFYGCTSLNTVTIPSTVTTLGGSLFSNCTGLQYITIPSSVTTISGDDLFSSCTNLAAVNIPGTISSGLGYSNMFIGCSKLKKTCKDSTPRTSGGYINFMTTNTSATFVDLKLNVEEIGAETFYGWSSLQTVDGVTNVKYIGDKAFYNCTSLKSDWISNMTILKDIGSAYGWSFYNCTSTNFKKITLPSGFKNLRDHSFQNCTNLEAVNIPSTIMTLGSAFSGCSKLTEWQRSSTEVTSGGIINLKFNDTTTCSATYFNLADVCADGFRGSNYPLKGFNSLRELVLPNMRIIGSYAVYSTTLGAFFGYTNYTGTYSVTQDSSTYYIPTSLKTVRLKNLSNNNESGLAAYAFQDCYRLTTVECTGSGDYKTIPQYAFYGCSGLTGLSSTLKSGIVTVSAYAFSYCTGLTSVTIPNTVKTLFNDVFTGCNYITSVTFTSTSKVSQIGNGCFNGCSRLSSITLPSSLTALGNHVFYGCSGLSGTFTIPSNCRGIGQYCFVGTSLSGITFQSTMTWYTASSGTGDWLMYGSSGLVRRTVTNSSTNATNLRTNGSWSTLWMIKQ